MKYIHSVSYLNRQGDGGSFEGSSSPSPSSLSVTIKPSSFSKSSSPAISFPTPGTASVAAAQQHSLLRRTIDILFGVTDFATPSTPLEQVLPCNARYVMHRGALKAKAHKEGEERREPIMETPTTGALRRRRRHMEMSCHPQPAAGRKRRNQWRGVRPTKRYSSTLLYPHGGCDRTI